LPLNGSHEVVPTTSFHAGSEDPEIKDNAESFESAYIIGVYYSLFLFGRGTLVAILIMLDHSIMVTSIRRIAHAFTSIKDVG
jgi:hypothetical protein